MFDRARRSLAWHIALWPCLLSWMRILSLWWTLRMRSSHYLLNIVTYRSDGADEIPNDTVCETWLGLGVLLRRTARVCRLPRLSRLSSLTWLLLAIWSSRISRATAVLLRSDSTGAWSIAIAIRVLLRSVTLILIVLGLEFLESIPDDAAVLAAILSLLTIASGTAIVFSVRKVIIGSPVLVRHVCQWSR